MTDFLEIIIAAKKREVDVNKEHTTLRDLERRKYFKRVPLSLVKSLSDPFKTGIIAEFKRMSPSKGIINSEVKIAEVTAGYARAGASGISILTDKEFFGGCKEDLLLTRERISVPVLRKEFIIDEFQVIESKAIGADVILLLASALNKDQALKLAKLAHSLGLEVILEVHSLSELELINDYANIIGVNNRDLKSFIVDTTLSEELAEKIPEKYLKISESGISSPETVMYLRTLGYKGFLIGELFMSRKNPVVAFMDFNSKISLIGS